MSGPVQQRRILKPEELVPAAFARVDKRLRAVENPVASTIQRASVLNQAGVSGSAATTFQTLASVTVEIPSADSFVLYWWFLTDLHVSVGTTTVQVALRDGIDFTDAAPLQLMQTTRIAALASYPALAPASFSQNAADTWFTGGGVPLTFGPPFTMTPGTHTYQLSAKRTAGAGTWTATGAYLWVLVV